MFLFSFAEHSKNSNPYDAAKSLASPNATYLLCSRSFLFPISILIVSGGEFYSTSLIQYDIL
jgi:hypothetical protein